MLVFTDGTHELKLNYKECTDLELKLNVSAYGKLWGHLGQILYEHATKKSTKEQEFTIYKEELEFLHRLLEKASWEQCQGMK